MRRKLDAEFVGQSFLLKASSTLQETMRSVTTKSAVQSVSTYSTYPIRIDKWRQDMTSDPSDTAERDRGGRARWSGTSGVPSRSCRASRPRWPSIRCNRSPSSRTDPAGVVRTEPHRSVWLDWPRSLRWIYRTGNTRERRLNVQHKTTEQEYTRIHGVCEICIAFY